MRFPPAFTDPWPSKLTEFAGGFGCVFLASPLMLLPVDIALRILLVLAAAMAISLIYERYFDRNGWNVEDVEERIPGILAACLCIAVGALAVMA